MRINQSNFPKVNLWVSSACQAKSGNTTYWASIDEYNGGALLYLAKSVWGDLTEVNETTVWNVLKSGKFEITEAHSRETGETLTTENGEIIYQVSKAKETVECQW